MYLSTLHPQVPEVPMASWKVAFEGKMRSVRTQTMHQVIVYTSSSTLHVSCHVMSCCQVRIDARYTAISPHFDFDSEMSAWTVARAMAREPWSREVSAAPSDDCIVCDLTCV